MPFQVPASAGDKPEGRFDFQLPGAKKSYSIPKLDYLPGDMMLRVAGFQDAVESDQFSPAQLETIFTVLEDLCDAPVRALALDQLMALYNAWADASEIAPGESNGSEISSETTDPKLSTPSSRKGIGSGTPARQV